MAFWRNLTKEFNQSYLKSQSNKKMMMLDTSRKSKMKSKNLELSLKESQKKKSKDM